MEIPLSHSYMIEHYCRTKLPHNSAQVEEPIVEIDLHLNKKYRWGFFDSLRGLVTEFPATPPFQTEATKFSYFLYDTSATNLMSDHCKEDLQQSNLCPEFAGDIANDVWTLCRVCIEHYEDVMKHQNLYIAAYVELESVFAYEDYLNNGANLESFEEEFPLSPASESTIQALVKATAADDNSLCTVCMEEFAKGEEVTRMPCKHVFHSNCIVPWLKNMNTCPNCRTKIN